MGSIPRTPPRNETVLSQSETLAHLRLASRLARVDVDEVVVPTDHHAVVDGLRLHDLDWGHRDRPALIFLHGGRLTAHTWDLVCLAMRADFHCLAIDQRGHGDSEDGRRASTTSPTHTYATSAG